MTIQDIDDQIKLQQTKLSIATDDAQRQAANKRIKILRYKREIESIKDKIMKMDSY